MSETIYAIGWWFCRSSARGCSGLQVVDIKHILDAGMDAIGALRPAEQAPVSDSN